MRLFRQIQVGAILTSKQTFQFQSVSIQSHVKVWFDTFLIWYFSEIREWGNVPSVEFTAFNFVIGLLVIVKMTVVLNTSAIVAG